MSAHEENLRDAMREPEGLCGVDGCTFTDHYDNQHSWKPPCGHLNLDPTGFRVMPWRCVDCGLNVSQREAVEIVARAKLLSAPSKEK